MRNFRLFTLIELLVVVAVIGILTSMLLPAIGKAREAGKRSLCINNQKQLGISLHMYTNDYDGLFPGADGSTTTTWDDGLAGLDGRPFMDAATKANDNLFTTINEEHVSELYVCPNDNVDRQEVAGLHFIKKSYVMNAYYPHSGLPQFKGIFNLAPHVGLRRESDVLKPSNAIAITEIFSMWNSMGRSLFADYSANHHLNQNLLVNGFPHLKTYNYLFVDGHVESLDYYKTIQGATSGVANVTGSMWDAGPQP